MPNILTRKQKWFAGLVFVAVAFVLGAIIYIFIRGHSASQGGKPFEAAVAFLYGILGALIIAAVTFAFGPIKTSLQTYLDAPANSEDVRVLLFGQTGSGKSSFAQHALTLKPLAVRQADKIFTPISGTVALETGKGIPVIFGDYCGEEPAQVTSQIPSDFAGSQGNRIIDALIIFVDVIGRQVASDNEILSDAALIEWLREDPERRINERLKDHNLYVTSAILQILFTAILSSRLKSVFLVINKADLIEQGVEAGLISPIAADEFQEVVTEYFRDIVARINVACVRNKIEPCIGRAISLRDESARKFIFEAFSRIDQLR